MGLNPDLLEADAAAMLQDPRMPADQVTAALLFSAAISLKRIADQGEPINIDGGAVEPPAAPLSSSMIEIVPSSLVKLTTAPVEPLETPPIPQGFTPYDGSGNSPVDRNHQVIVFYRRGKPSKPTFSGSINWAWKGTKDDVLGWRYLGDGAEVSATS